MSLLGEASFLKLISHQKNVWAPSTFFLNLFFFLRHPCFFCQPLNELLSVAPVPSQPYSSGSSKRNVLVLSTGEQ